MELPDQRRCPEAAGFAPSFTVILHGGVAGRLGQASHVWGAPSTAALVSSGGPRRSRRVPAGAAQSRRRAEGEKRGLRGFIPGFMPSSARAEGAAGRHVGIGTELVRDPGPFHGAMYTPVLWFQAMSLVCPSAWRRRCARSSSAPAPPPGCRSTHLCGTARLPVLIGDRVSPAAGWPRPGVVPSLAYGDGAPGNCILLNWCGLWRAVRPRGRERRRRPSSGSAASFHGRALTDRALDVCLCCHGRAGAV